jgi:dTDP-4-dehydrorhamnose reductase
MRVVVTGSNGRLGTAVMGALATRASDMSAVGWSRNDFDLDRPEGVSEALAGARTDAVVHAAAWTDVDGCALDPDLAIARNAEATGFLARACADRAIRLIFVSTNEVFDGTRIDGRPYGIADEPQPGNAYGRSKRGGEEAAAEAYAGGRGDGLTIVRTSWLFGRPDSDFPAKILKAAMAARARGTTLRLVADEYGSPSYATDVANGILALLEAPSSSGLHHVVNTGVASRATWARAVLEGAGVEVMTEDVSLASWMRPSRPPLWGVLEPTSLPRVGRLRPWREALEADLQSRLAAAPDLVLGVQ